MLRRISRAFPPFSGSRTLGFRARPRADAARRRAAARRLPARMVALRDSSFAASSVCRSAAAGIQVVRAAAVPARIGVSRRASAARRCRALRLFAAPRTVVRWRWVPQPVVVLLRGTFGKPLRPSQPRPRARIARRPLTLVSALTYMVSTIATSALLPLTADAPVPLSTLVSVPAPAPFLAPALLSRAPPPTATVTLTVTAAVATCLLRSC